MRPSAPGALLGAGLAKSRTESAGVVVGEPQYAEPHPAGGDVAVAQQVTEVRSGKQRVHQTRVVASARQMWLNLEEASAALRQRLEEAVSGLL